MRNVQAMPKEHLLIFANFVVIKFLQKLVS